MRCTCLICIEMFTFFAFLSLLFPAVASLRPCTQNDYHYEYTQCDSKGGRWRVQVPKSPDLCQPGSPSPPVRGKDCDFKCEKGKYLDLDSQECKACSPGTFALGNGERFEEWDSLPPGFASTTETFIGHFYRNENDDEDNVNCSMHEFTPKGNYISALPGPCSSQLSYTATLVNPGYIHFEYQFADSSSSIFHFTVQNDQCEAASDPDDSHRRNAFQWPVRTKKGEWRTIKAKLRKGLNIFKWKVIGLNSHGSERTSVPVLIRKIEITGVGFSTVCTKCTNGTYSSAGAESCTPCKADTYSERGADICKPCDLTTEFSYKGSDSCTKKKPCTKADYYQYQLPCTNGKTQTAYEWIMPKICRSNVQGEARLPNPTEPVDCPPCNPGMYLSSEGGCQFCPAGQQSDGKSPCKSCLASTSPDYQLQYNWWNSMPVNMSSECILFDDDNECQFNNSWIPMGDHIHTHFSHGEDPYLLLVLKISGFRTTESADERKVVGTVSFDFSLSCTERCVFGFIVDKGEENAKIESEWKGNLGKTHYTYKITNSGPIVFSWVFERSVIGDIFSGHVSNDDVAKIYDITVTNSIDGGAVGCTKCPKGIKNDMCIPCPSGHYIDVNTTTCTACPPDTIIRSNNAWGKENCEVCGQGLIASADGDKCITECTFTDGAGRVYDFKNLNNIKSVKGSNLFTGTGTKYYHNFNVSLCGGDKMVTCKQNVSTEKSDQKNKLSYATSVKSTICRTTMIPSNDEQRALSTQPISLGDYITKIVSNQSLKELYEKGGFDSKDTKKDIHFYYKAEGATDSCPDGRKTIISLRCDQKLEEEGELMFPPNCVYGTCDGCNFHFLWKTMYACPKCAKEDYVKIVGECSDGSQQVHYTKPNHCLGVPPATETQPCSLKFPFIVKVVVPPVVGLGIILLICVLYCWQRNKSLEYKYMKLVQGNDGPNYDGELPGVDSCALSDGEEDQFDSVHFKESRGSKLLNKLRGKRSDKDDENPFETGHGEKIPLT